MRLKEIKPGMVIHCKTEEEANALMVELNKLGYTWGSCVKSTHHTNWKTYREETCYRLEAGTFGFANKDYYATVHNITEFSDLIIPELSAKEVLEIMGEICDSIYGCDNCCPMWNYCSHKEFGSKAEETIDICTKWREEHPKEEKKELETEWVYVVRIIKVHENGKKECVHEVVCNIEFSDMDKVSEAELKHYCSEHDGNFFATLEHICRIKE